MTDDEEGWFDSSVDLMREILTAWDDRDLSRRYSANDKISSLANVPLVYGLAAHTHLLGHTVADLLDDGAMLQAQPLVRLMYECALTAQWSALTRDSPQAMSNEHSRLQRAMSKELSEAGSPTLREGAGTLPYESAEPLETAAAEAARNFKIMCLELAVGGTDAYIYYRILSDLAHPSIRMVDRWLDASAGPDGPVTSLRVKPDQPTVDSLAAFANYSLIWAGAGFDYVLAGRPRRRKLEGFAKRAGIDAMLRIRPEVAQQRFAKQKVAKERARRQRRGPEPKPGTARS